MIISDRLLTFQYINQYYRDEFIMIMEFKLNFSGEQAVLYKFYNFRCDNFITTSERLWDGTTQLRYFLQFLILRNWDNKCLMPKKIAVCNKGKCLITVIELVEAEVISKIKQPLRIIGEYSLLPASLEKNIFCRKILL